MNGTNWNSVKIGKILMNFFSDSSLLLAVFRHYKYIQMSCCLETIEKQYSDSRTDCIAHNCLFKDSSEPKKR